MEFIEAAHHWTGREGQTVRYLVIHGTAGGTTAAGIADYFAQQTTEASAHYVIGVAGDIVQCVLEQDAAWSNGALTAGHATFWDALGGVNPNLVSIAIEHCKPSTDNSNVLTPEQKQASFQLVKDICQRWKIPTHWADASGGITGHYSLDPVSRAHCPGPYPFDELFAFLNQPAQPQKEDEMLQITDPFAAGHFKEDVPGQWHCTSTNKTVHGAILGFYQRILGASRLPMTDEMNNVPDVVWQLFEAGVIVYDPKHKCGSPVGFGDCYLLKFDDPIVKNVLVKPYVDAANSAAQAEKTAEDKAKALQVQVASLQNQLKQTQGPDQNQLKALLQALQNSEKAIQAFVK